MHFVKECTEKHMSCIWVVIELQENAGHELTVHSEMCLVDCIPQVSLHFTELEDHATCKCLWVASSPATTLSHHHCLHHLHLVTTS